MSTDGSVASPSGSGTVRRRGAIKAFAGGSAKLVECFAALADKDAVSGQGLFPDVCEKRRRKPDGSTWGAISQNQCLLDATGS
jgi:hypothetical protein